MSGSSKSNMADADNYDQRWAALDKQHERLVDASHPLLAELRREHPEIDRGLPAASLAATPPTFPRRDEEAR
jgi:hypothetical protein